MAARKRHDPTSRPADGRRAADVLRNADPTRHYVFANPNDLECGVQSYLDDEEMEYRVETATADGVRPSVGRTVSEGGQVTSKGQVLLSCPLVNKVERDQRMGATADAMERRILRDGHVDDAFRGQGRGRIAVDASETSPAMTLYGGA